MTDPTNTAPEQVHQITGLTPTMGRTLKMMCAGPELVEALAALIEENESPFETPALKRARAALHKAGYEVHHD